MIVHPASASTYERNEPPWLRPDYLRHTELTVYRCFLPDLTGFTENGCAGPGPQHHDDSPASQVRSRHGNSAPLERIAGTGHRWFPA